MSDVRIELQSYTKNICNGFARYQQNGDFVDMTLAAEGHLVKVHRNIMSLSSPYIEEILKSTPCSHPVMFLNNISHKVLTYILEYVYTGVASVPWNVMEEFTAACKQLHIIGVKDCNNTYFMGTTHKKNKMVEKRERTQPQTEQKNITEPVSIRPVETQSFQDNHTVVSRAHIPTIDVSRHDNNAPAIDVPTIDDDGDSGPAIDDDNISDIEISDTDIKPLQADDFNTEQFQTNDNLETFQANSNQNAGKFQTNHINETFQIDRNDIPNRARSTEAIVAFETFQINRNNMPNEAPSTEKITPSIGTANVKYKIDLSHINLESINDINLQQFINPIPIENTVEGLLYGGKVPENTIDGSTSLLYNVQESVIPKIGSEKNIINGSTLKRPASQNTAPIKIKRFLPQSTNQSDINIENSVTLQFPVENMKNTTIQNIIPVHQNSNRITIEYISDDGQNNAVLMEQAHNGSNECENTDQNAVNVDNELPNTSNLLNPTPLFTLSQKGKIQMMLNRYMYGTAFNAFNGCKRRWRCISYRIKRCKAYVDTANETVLYRVHEHNHGFHDQQILKKGRKDKIFTTISEARIYAIEHFNR